MIPRGLCVCRSRDVAVVKVTMNFEPNKVNIQKKNCRVEGKETVCINGTVCFNVKLKSKENVVYEAGKCHTYRSTLEQEDSVFYLLPQDESRKIVYFPR